MAVAAASSHPALAPGTTHDREHDLAAGIDLHGDARVRDQLALRLGQGFERAKESLPTEGEVDAGHPLT
jgi:hypothetical protein